MAHLPGADRWGLILGAGPEPDANDDSPARTNLGGRLPIQGEGGVAVSELDFTGQLIPVLERDTILALDSPAIVDTNSATSWIAGDELVLGVVIGGEARAYPLRVLLVHEVINDQLAGRPIVVTFCPLCFTAVAYDREIAGVVRTFGVSGYLLNSALVMFDRQRESLWSQVTGEALGGDEAGLMLTRVVATQTDWSTWSAAFPNTDVLDLGVLGGDARYSPDRFQSYLNGGSAGLIPLDVRRELPEKSLVAGLDVDGSARAYAFDGDRSHLIIDVGIAVWLDGATRTAVAYRIPREADLLLNQTLDGENRIVDQISGAEWRAIDGASLSAGTNLEALDMTVSFWFGWAAFYPETSLWTAAP